jgi:hypothetical protein
MDRGNTLLRDDNYSENVSPGLKEGKQLIGVLRPEKDSGRAAPGLREGKQFTAILRDILGSIASGGALTYYYKRSRDSSQEEPTYGYWINSDPLSLPPFSGGPWVDSCIISQRTVG